MITDNKATPTPWRIEGNKIVGADMIHSNGRPRNEQGISSASYTDRVCETTNDMSLEGPKANLELIVKAVNSYAQSQTVIKELLEVAKKLLTVLTFEGVSTTPKQRAEAERALRKVVAKAEALQATEVKKPL